MISEFLNEMARYIPQHARLMACQFRGDPEAVAGPTKWRSWPLTSVKQLDNAANVYLTVSAMQKNERGEYRRRKENFAGGLLLMIDDLGDGKGAKFPLTIIDALPPTALVETSSGNHQAIYMFNSLITDRQLFERLIKGFIDKQFLGKDTGMAGINRVFRPPYGVNGKAKHNGWAVAIKLWHPANRYSVQQIAQAYKIDLTKPSGTIPRGATNDKAESIKSFVLTRAALRSAGMLKTESADIAGWQDVVCPWIDGHTGGVDNGSGIREPNEENGWVGAFKCWHGSCQGHDWRALTEWLNDNQAAILQKINEGAQCFEHYKVAL